MEQLAKTRHSNDSTKDKQKNWEKKPGRKSHLRKRRWHGHKDEYTNFIKIRMAFKKEK